MKKIFYNIAIVLSLLVMFTACENQIEKQVLEDIKGVGTLVLSSEDVAVLKSTELGISYEMSDITSAVLTIEKDGAIVAGFDSKEVEVGSWGDGSISISGIDLANGSGYQITAFELKNSDATTTFASPKVDSAVEGWVETTLPISFDIADAENTSIDLQVVTTLGSTAERFGYSSFALTGEAASIASYLASFENVFVASGDSVVHIFSDRGVPAYSEVYRSNSINKSVIIDFVAVTYKHYYVDGDTPIVRVDQTYSGNRYFEDVQTYNIKTDEATSAIIEIEKPNYKEIYSVEGLLVQKLNLNDAGAMTSRYDYTYTEDNNQDTSKEFDSNGYLVRIFSFDYDANGNVTESEEYNGEGTFVNKRYYTYDNNLLIQAKYYSITSSNEELLFYTLDYKYSEGGLLLEEVSNQYNNSGDVIYNQTDTYTYNGSTPISYVESYNYGDPSNSYDSEELIDEKGSYLYGVELRDDMKFVSDFKGVPITCSYPLDGGRNVTISFARSYYNYTYSLTNSEGVVTKTARNDKIDYLSVSGVQIGYLELWNSSYTVEYLETPGVVVPTTYPKNEADFKLLEETYLYSEEYSNSSILIDYDSSVYDADNNYGTRLYKYMYSNDELVEKIDISIFYSSYEKLADEVLYYVVNIYDLTTGEVASAIKYSPTGEIML